MFLSLQAWSMPLSFRAGPCAPHLSSLSPAVSRVPHVKDPGASPVQTCHAARAVPRQSGLGPPSRASPTSTRCLDPRFPLPLLPMTPLKRGAARRRRTSVLFPSSILPSKHPTSNPPSVAFLTAPTVVAPSLTRNLATPPTPPPLRDESYRRAPSSPLLQLGSTLTSPSLSQSRMHASGQRWSPSGLTPPPTAVVPKSLCHPTVVPPPR
jgi:hypothetical protein